jgi:hypothetical protein
VAEAVSVSEGTIEAAAAKAAAAEATAEAVAVGGDETQKSSPCRSPDRPRRRRTGWRSRAPLRSSPACLGNRTERTGRPVIATEKSAEGIVGGVIRRRPERWKRRVDTCISMEPCGRTPVFSGLCANLKGEAQRRGDAGKAAGFPRRPRGRERHSRSPQTVMADRGGKKCPPVSGSRKPFPGRF